MRSHTALFALVVSASCYVAPSGDPASEPARGSFERDLVSDASPRCEVNPCFLCPPPSGLCRLTGCVAPDPDGNVCYEFQSPPGQSCATGVGLCNAAGECVIPGGKCAPGPVGQWSHGCKQNVDCDDGNPCTQDECGNALGLGSCYHNRIPDGTGCGVGMICTSGLCCVPPDM